MAESNGKGEYTAQNKKSDGRKRRLSNLTPWKPGQSGNPSGRPKRTPYAEAYLKIADLRVGDLRVRKTDTVPDAIAKAMAREGIRGRVRAAVEVANRTEGTPTQSLQHEIPSDNEVKTKVKTPDRNGLGDAIRQIYGISPRTAGPTASSGGNCAATGGSRLSHDAQSAAGSVPEVKENHNGQETIPKVREEGRS
jgi:hypothetical protein